MLDIKTPEGRKWLYQKLRDVLGKGLAVLLPILVVVISGMGILLFNASRWVLDTWGLISMDEIMFQLKVPMQGTNSDIIEDFVIQCVPSAILAALLLVAVLTALRGRRRTAVLAGSALLSMALVGNGLRYLYVNLDVAQYIANQNEEASFIEDNYVNPNEVNLQFPERKRNLVYIFLESMEATYFDYGNGGAYPVNYIPELTALAAGNINFSENDGTGGIYAAAGNTWTMGGLAGQTSGLPLKLEIKAGAFDDGFRFLPLATTIGDILEREGYSQTIMFGSDAAFAARKNYFAQHGNYDILDYNYAVNAGWIPEGYAVWWGYEDQKLFQFAKDRLTELAMQPQPFNFTMLTADTHFENGCPCPKCEDIFGEQYANVMACSSRQVEDFVLWIQQQPFYENTTIVIVGDHLTMDSDFCESVDPDYKRTVYNTIINSAVGTEYSKNRTATTMDMFPTTLASMGVQIEGEKLGLGTNLFSGVPTLAEQTGIDRMNNELQKKSKFFEYLLQGNDGKGHEYAFEWWERSGK